MSQDLISIIMPAYKAQDFIEHSASSVLRQTYPDWELLIISDDMFDYESHLKEGLNMDDERIRFFSTGEIGAGASAARNVGLSAASGESIAILDADDAFYPNKLETCVPLLKKHPFISCAIDVCDQNGTSLRYVGGNHPEGELPTKQYKSVHFSMDSMIMFRRDDFPYFYDEELKCWNDFEFILQCFQGLDSVYTMPSPLHYYYKQPNSISNNPESHQNYATAKQEILNRLENNIYDLAPATKEAMIQFVKTSIETETLFEKKLKTDPDALFEDVMEGRFGG